MLVLLQKQNKQTYTVQNITPANICTTCMNTAKNSSIKTNSVEALKANYTAL